MAEYLTNTADLTAVADAIRAKGGASEQLVYPSGFVSAISAIETGGGGECCTECLTWSASSEFTVSPFISGGMQGGVWDGTIEISYNQVSWEVWDGSTTITAKPYGNIYRFFMRGSGNHFITTMRIGATISPFNVSIVDGGVSVTGNIWTLLDWQKVKDGSSDFNLTGKHIFSALFAVLDASKAWMSRCPSLSPVRYVYDNMFAIRMLANQVLLTTIPAIDYIDSDSPIMWRQVFYGLYPLVRPNIELQDETQGIYVFGKTGSSGVSVNVFGLTDKELVSGTRYCVNLEVV